MQNYAEAYWQALPVNFLKHGMNVAVGLRTVVEVMLTDEYASFSDRIPQAEFESMESLQMMQGLPCLAERQQVNYAGQISHQVTMLTMQPASAQIPQGQESSHS